jgi:hypothetical protein
MPWPVSTFAWQYLGDAADYTYGDDPNNADTWDAHRIFGCLCDEGSLLLYLWIVLHRVTDDVIGFTGYDCSLRTCPSGDDPGTYEDHVEVQMLQCIGEFHSFISLSYEHCWLLSRATFAADDGYFTLSFRQAVTGRLNVNITATELKYALQNLTTLTKLSVYYTRDGPIPNVTLGIEKPRLPLPEGNSK